MASSPPRYTKAAAFFFMYPMIPFSFHRRCNHDSRSANLHAPEAQRRIAIIVRTLPQRPSETGSGFSTLCRKDQSCLVDAVAYCSGHHGDYDPIHSDHLFSNMLVFLDLTIGTVAKYNKEYFLMVLCFVEEKETDYGTASSGALHSV